MSQDNPFTSKPFKPKPDIVLLKLVPDVHPLSAEEQILFVRITEGIYGLNEQIRTEAFKLVASSYDITKITQYLTVFIKEAVEANIVLTDLTLLIYSVRLTKTLLLNKHVHLQEHIHHLLPAMLSCVLSKKISKYRQDNHWAVRDVSTYVVHMICQRYNTKLNNMRQRVIDLYVRALQESRPLTTVYGAVKGLAEFGEECVRTHLLPNIVFLSKQIVTVLEKQTISEHKQRVIEAKHVKDLLLYVVVPLLYKIQGSTDGGLNYVQKFGYLGHLIYNQVRNMQARANVILLVNNSNRT